MPCLRKILRIKWQDKISDTEVLFPLPTVYTLLMLAQVRWAGHVVRMDSERIRKQLLCGELTHGRPCRGGQKRRFKDKLKVSLKSVDIDTDSWENQTQDHPSWCALITKGSCTSEAKRSAKALRKREQRKARAASTTTELSPRVYPACGRTLRARIGLISHLRTHRTLTSSVHRHVRGPHPSRWTKNNNSNIAIIQAVKVVFQKPVYVDSPFLTKLYEKTHMIATFY